MVYPVGSAIGVAEVDLMIFDVDAGMTKRISYSDLASLDELLDVLRAAEHDVVASRFEDLPHHRL